MHKANTRRFECSNFDIGQKNNEFQFCEDKKFTRNFTWTNFKYLHIYEDKKKYFTLLKYRC